MTQLRTMKRLKAPLSIFFCATMLSFILAACPGGPTYNSQESYATCETDDECPAGRACSDQGYCLPILVTKAGIGIELVPTEARKDAQDSLVQVEYGPDQLSLDDSGVLLVPYEPAVPIKGSVSVPSAPLAAEGFSQFQTRVTLWRASRIPGRPRVTYSSSLTFDMTDAPIDGMAVLQYGLTVPGGFSYQARAVPESGYDNVVPPSTDVILDLTNAPETYRQDFDFSSKEFSAVEGRVTDAMGAPLGDVQVEMIDSQGRRLSTRAATAPNEGDFQVLYPKDLSPLQDYTLLLTPADSAAMVLPQLRIPLSLQDSGDTDIGTIAYPPLRTERCSFQFRIVGQSSSGTSEPVPGAKISFSTEFTDDGTGIATHSVDAVTAPDGTVSVALISGANAEPRKYRVAVLPPVDSAYAAKLDTIDVSGCGGAASTIQLPQRTEIVGTVRSVTEGPVPNLAVSARPIVNTISRDDPTPASMMLESGHAPSATSAADGRFYLRLDPGRYDLELTPPAGSPLSRWLVTGITIDDDAQTTSVQVTMPSPVLLKGKVQSPDGSPVTGFVVRAYLVPPECTKADWIDCTESAFLLSEAQLRPDGGFSLVLPDNL